MNVEELFYSQKHFYNKDNTKNIESRRNALLNIQSWIMNHEDDIKDALTRDLGKCGTESYLTEIGKTLNTISELLRNLDKWTKRTKSSSFFIKNYTLSQPYGTVLIISSWHYPFLLAIDPLVNAIAAGNTVVLKTDDYAPYTSQLIKEMMMELFDKGYVAVINGDERVTRELLLYPFDSIFYTGSSNYGKIVYKKAADHLTPVTLLLNSKSTAVVSSQSDIDQAAKRIAYSKVINAGQSNLAPDYVFVEKSIKKTFVNAYIKYLAEFFNEDPLTHQQYTHIINRQHFNRLIKLMENTHIIYGGQTESESLKIAPTLIDHVSEKDAIIKEDIFGPLLPIITYEDIHDVVQFINRQEKSLALYIFSEDRLEQDLLINNCNFGNACINDTFVPFLDDDLPFNILGQYANKYSFDTFSQTKSIIVDGKRDSEDLYFPFDSEKENNIKRQLK